MDEMMTVGRLPVLALRGLAVFPDQTVHFEVGRKKSVLALEEAMRHDQTLFLVPQKDISVDDPRLSDLYPIGAVGKIKQILRSQGDSIRVLVTGICRARIESLHQEEPYLSGTILSVPETEAADTVRGQALRREANALYAAYLEHSEFPGQTIQMRMLASKNCGFLADCIAQNSGIDYAQKLRLLSTMQPVRRLEMALRFLRQEMELLSLESEIQEKTKASMDRQQRDYYLREQLKTIHEELGQDEEREFDAYEQKILALDLPQEHQEKLLKDLIRLRKQPFGSSESAVLQGYLDTVLALPWNTRTRERVDVAAARKVLERDHFGLEKVKERILQTIAVRQMAPKLPPQVLCLVGPPGVGKTSVAYSVAAALNRKMARISLGGIHDEAEIRGHRKTYVGAMPGRIMAAVSQAGTKNPLILLDEIDKLGHDHRGDPSAALLEVLDGEQNSTYRDHYLEIPFDLSDVMFITTANSLDTVPRPLLDRMEVIELGSYTDEEKRMIAKNHLLPKQKMKHGLKRNQLTLTDDAIREIISCYTRESGVRNLERCFAEICRKADMELLSTQTRRVRVTGSNIEHYLGIRRYLPDRIPANDQIGLVTGLAWTSVGGAVLEVEVNVLEGTGKLELTGNLGDVMKESAQAALSYIRANAKKWNIGEDFYKTKDIHVHFPEGAVPKDGPSAGITVCTAMVSALAGIPVHSDVAMTGEISLRGRVLPIGGLKEKTMAALRHGIRTVVIPEDNRRDLEEIDPMVRNALNFITAKTADTVLETALCRNSSPVLDGLLTTIPDEARASRRKPGIRQ